MPKRVLPAVIVCILAAILMFTAGCSFIPEYQRPAMPVEGGWSNDAVSASSDEAPAGVNTLMAADVAWQDYFKSETLRQLIGLALENNRDLRVAVLNIEKARAAYGIQKSKTFPVVTGNAGASRQGVAEDASASGKAYTTDTSFQANLAVTAYELDFFGRVSALNQQALETFLNTEQAALNARIALIAQTANAYITLLADKKLLGLARETYQVQKETYRVIKSQFEVGSATQLDIAQAATSVESARVSMAQYTRQVAQDQSALTLLCGTSIREFLNARESIDDIAFIDALPAGLSSQVLLARPDIRAAEHTLRAANADIGAARAALYPTISLTGSLGFTSQSLSDLFGKSKNLAWSFAPSLSIPIFNREGIKASLASAKVSEKIAAAQYEGAVQTAFKEVADQLSARRTYKDQLAAQCGLVAASRKAYSLSKARYDNGIDDFLAVLDSQRVLFSAQQGAITIKQAYLSNLVSLYKVLGGGQI